MRLITCKASSPLILTIPIPELLIPVAIAAMVSVFIHFPSFHSPIIQKAVAYATAFLINLSINFVLLLCAFTNCFSHRLCLWCRLVRTASAVISLITIRTASAGSVISSLSFTGNSFLLKQWLHGGKVPLLRCVWSHTCHSGLLHGWSVFHKDS